MRRKWQLLEEALRRKSLCPLPGRQISPIGDRPQVPMIVHNRRGWVQRLYFLRYVVVLPDLE